jgi:hypothetical protein
MIGLKAHLTLNGRELSGVNTILSTGFNLLGRRIFDAAYTTQAYWIRVDLDTGNEVFEATYTEISATQHELFYLYTLPTGPGTISAMHVMKENSLLDTHKIASYAVTPPQAAGMGDSFHCDFEFIVSNQNGTWTSDGTKMIGHRCFDKANTYGLATHLAYWNGGAQQKIYALGYTNISNTSHKVGVTTDAAITSDSLRLYSAASGGTLYWNATGTRIYPNGFAHNIVMEVSQ